MEICGGFFQPIAKHREFPARAEVIWQVPPAMWLFAVSTAATCFNKD